MNCEHCFINIYFDICCLLLLERKAFIETQKVELTRMEGQYIDTTTALSVWLQLNRGVIIASCSTVGRPMELVITADGPYSY
jgi:hypothetical protein